MVKNADDDHHTVIIIKIAVGLKYEIHASKMSNSDRSVNF